MAEKIFSNVRFGFKVDTLENWNNSTLALKKGEIAIATVAATAGTALAEPVVMIKIGEDGVKTFKDLGWNFYAKASDVVAACKSEDALKTFINNVIAEAGIATDEALTTLAGRVTTVEGAITTLNGDATVEGSVAKEIADAIAALDLANTYEIKGAAADVQDAIEEKIGEVTEGKTVVEMIADAQAAATYDDTQVKADIKANADAIDAIEADYLKAADKAELQGNIDTLAGRVTTNEGDIATLKGNSSVDGSVDKKIADAINTFATQISDDETVNTYKELINYAATHGSEFTELVGEVDANAKAIETLNGDSTVAGSVDKKIADAIAAENLGQYATDTELSALTERVTAAEGDIDALEAKVGEESVATQIEAAIEALKIGDYAKAADLAAALERVEQNETDITALEDAVADKANDADLAAVAKSGLVDDLTLGEGTVLVFDCGTSADVTSA